MPGAQSTTDEVLAAIDLSGRTAVVTGASGGLGLETARALAARGAHVVLAARDAARTEEAMESIRAQHPDSSLAAVTLDLGSLVSVEAAADELLAMAPQIDLLINNAGVMACPFSRTADGFELQFGTNHLGHFLFTNLLAPSVLRARSEGGARVINLSSAGHSMGDVDFDDPNFERREYNPWVAYGQSKSANILFSVGLDARWVDFGVRSLAVHPGGIHTDLGRHLTAETVAFLQTRLAAAAEANERSGAPAFQWKSIPQGAATSVWAATAPELEGVGGRYCEDCGLADIRPEGASASGQVSASAVDTANAERLWELSERLIGRRFRYPS
jgi:NAD(P)-dependent dehydrogenase (short-subunit alcohol dehydrogenase family)